MTFKVKTVIFTQLLLIVFLASYSLILTSDLNRSRKTIIDQSNFCIKYTSDTIAHSQLNLIREQDAHGRTLDKSNVTIVNLVNRYNTFITKYNKSTNGINYDLLNQYSYMTTRTVP